ncbi:MULTISPECIES: hypothetical protein [Vibrio]|uniref:hypothetical protein n=1 Tax=Vibrio TaxID=662 RepID=UPI001CCCB648|nr:MULTISPECIES: hypothetical protein [Vibrio]EGR0722848.1 hypothetical protein [Vibrio alginolyticus]EJE3289575.1 hypothetical protein [Vibrio alginolyticus]ELA7328144.1 hypothetical protein [Vibrio alginolyticus]ELA7388947.1 hypothetical protein [Vibrio alginolyticus]ELB2876640.1 hypothetical protein [Vibrio alginolyticus]
MPQDKMTFDQIAKVADDVRTIQRFQDESVNEGFDSSFMAAQVVPSVTNNNKRDTPLIMFSLLVVGFCFLVGLRYVVDISPKIEELLLVMSLIVAVLATLSAQLKFKDSMVTGIVAVGFLFVLSIGFGIFTPKEAITEVKEFVK